MSLAWHTAALTRIALSKKKNGQWVDMPKLETMMSGHAKRKSEPMSPEQQWVVMASLVPPQGNR